MPWWCWCHNHITIIPVIKASKHWNNLQVERNFLDFIKWNLCPHKHVRHSLGNGAVKRTEIYGFGWIDCWCLIFQVKKQQLVCWFQLSTDQIFCSLNIWHRKWVSSSLFFFFFEFPCEPLHMCSCAWKAHHYSSTWNTHFWEWVVVWLWKWDNMDIWVFWKILKEGQIFKLLTLWPSEGNTQVCNLKVWKMIAWFFRGKTTCKTILRFSLCPDKETLKKQFHVMLVQIRPPEAFKLGLKSRWCGEFVSYWSAEDCVLWRCHCSSNKWELWKSLDSFKWKVRAAIGSWIGLS